MDFLAGKNDLLLLRLAGISISMTQPALRALYNPAMFLKPCETNSERLKESVRISLSPENTIEDLHTLIKPKNYRVSHMAFNHSVKKLSLRLHSVYSVKELPLKGRLHFFETKVGNYELTLSFELAVKVQLKSSLTRNTGAKSTTDS